MTLLESIAGPRDLKALSPDQLPALASEIRDFLIDDGVPERRAPRARTSASSS